MFKWWNENLRVKLISSFAIVLLVPSLLIGVLSYQSAKSKIEEEIVDSAQNTVHFLNNSIDLLISPKIQHMTYLSESLSVQGSESGTLEIVKQRLEQYQNLQSEVITTYLGTETGLFINHPVSPMPEEYDPRKRDWYQAAMMNKGQVIITDPYEDASSKEVVVSIVAALADGSGVVGIDLSLEKLRAVAGQYTIGNQGFAYIVDKTGKILVHPQLNNGVEASGSLFDPIFEQDTGKFVYKENGEDKQTVFETNKMTGWKLAGTMLFSEVKQELQPVFNTTLAVVLISVVAGAGMIFLMIVSIMGPIRSLMNATEKISEGNLTERILVRSKDEIGQLGIRFNHMIESLVVLITGIRQTVDHLAASSEELTAGSKQTGYAAEHIAESIQQVASNTELQVQSVTESERLVEDFTTGVQQVSQNARNVTSAAAYTSELAEQGNITLKNAVHQMSRIQHTINHVSVVIQELGARSGEIGQIVEDITNISGQTNLLALNASIEAARAGEHGRGFAVVAGEVRKLAELSSLSASKITNLITAIQEETNQAVLSIDLGTREVETGMDVVHVAAESFERIKESIQDVTGQIQEVSAASDQMSAGTKQLNRTAALIKEASVNTANGAIEISADSQEQSAAMEEIAASSASLAVTAEELQEMVSKFRV